MALQSVNINTLYVAQNYTLIKPKSSRNSLALSKINCNLNGTVTIRNFTNEPVKIKRDTQGAAYKPRPLIVILNRDEIVRKN